MNQLMRLTILLVCVYLSECWLLLKFFNNALNGMAKKNKNSFTRQHLIRFYSNYMHNAHAFNAGIQTCTVYIHTWKWLYSLQKNSNMKLKIDQTQITLFLKLRFAWRMISYIHHNKARFYFNLMLWISKIKSLQNYTSSKILDEVCIDWSCTSLDADP